MTEGMALIIFRLYSTLSKVIAAPRTRAMPSCQSGLQSSRNTCLVGAEFCSGNARLGGVLGGQRAAQPRLDGRGQLRGSYNLRLQPPAVIFRRSRHLLVCRKLALCTTSTMIDPNSDILTNLRR